MHRNINVAVGGPINANYPKVYVTKFLKPTIPFALQVTEQNTKYVIKHNFDLGSETIAIPENCILEFDGGSISNGFIVFDNTLLTGGVNLNNCEFTGEIKNDTIYSKWFNTDDFNTFAPILAAGNKTFIFDGTYNVSKRIPVGSNTKVIGVSKETAILKYNTSVIVEIFYTPEIHSTDYDNCATKDVYGWHDIYFSNFAVDYNTANIDVNVSKHWFVIYDCENLTIENIKLITPVQIPEYPKAITLKGCRNVTVKECTSRIAPLLFAEYCCNIDAIRNSVTDIKSTFLEYNGCYYGSQSHNTAIGFSADNRSCLSSNSRNITFDGNYIDTGIVDGEQILLGYIINLGHTDSEEHVASNNIVKNNYIKGGFHGVLSQNSKDTVIFNNYIESSKAVLFAAVDKGSVTFTQNTLKCLFKAATTTNGGSRIQATTNIVIANNIIFKNSYLGGYILRVVCENSNVVFEENNTSDDVFGRIWFVCRNLAIRNNKLKNVRVQTDSPTAIIIAYNYLESNTSFVFVNEQSNNRINSLAFEYNTFNGLNLDDNKLIQIWGNGQPNVNFYKNIIFKGLQFVDSVSNVNALIVRIDSTNKNIPILSVMNSQGNLNNKYPLHVGYSYLDTVNFHKPFIYDGTNWRDTNGIVLANEYTIDASNKNTAFVNYTYDEETQQGEATDTDYYYIDDNQVKTDTGSYRVVTDFIMVYPGMKVRLLVWEIGGTTPSVIGFDENKNVLGVDYTWMITANEQMVIPKNVRYIKLQSYVDIVTQEYFGAFIEYPT